LRGSTLYEQLLQSCRTVENTSKREQIPSSGDYSRYAHQ